VATGLHYDYGGYPSAIRHSFFPAREWFCCMTELVRYHQQHFVIAVPEMVLCRGTYVASQTRSMPLQGTD
jgi:hypothetical protein